MLKSNEKYKKITISFTEADMDIYEYLINLDNASKFIRDAVREKINGENKFTADVKKAVKEVFQEMDMNKTAIEQFKPIEKTQDSNDINIFSNDEDLKRALDSFEL